MVGESTLNEYKSFKALVKHKRRVNRVFSELGAETALRSRPPGVDKKVLAVVLASYSVAPPKAPRKKASKRGRGKSEVGDISSSNVRPEKTKSLESSKSKLKASEGISDAEVRAASSLTQLVQKKAKKVSYGPPWAHYLGGYQDRLLGGPLGLPGLRYTAPEGVEHKDYTGIVLG
jgi:hypothetical protein